MVKRIGLSVCSAILVSIATITPSHAFHCELSGVPDNFRLKGAREVMSPSGPLAQKHSLEVLNPPIAQVAPGPMPPERNQAPAYPSSIWRSEYGPATGNRISSWLRPGGGAWFAADHDGPAGIPKPHGAGVSGYAPMVPPAPQDSLGKGRTSHR